MVRIAGMAASSLRDPLTLRCHSQAACWRDRSCKKAAEFAGRSTWTTLGNIGVRVNFRSDHHGKNLLARKCANSAPAFGRAAVRSALGSWRGWPDDKPQVGNAYPFGQRLFPLASDNLVVPRIGYGFLTILEIWNTRLAS